MKYEILKKMIRINDIVYYKWRDCYVKYYVKKIIDDLIIVNQFRSKLHNCLDKSEVLTEAEMRANYNGETIYE